MPLLAISFMQFLSPTVQVLLAVTVLGESLTPEMVAAFVCIWLAVAIFIGDAVVQTRQQRRVSRDAQRSVPVPLRCATRLNDLTR